MNFVWVTCRYSIKVERGLPEQMQHAQDKHLHVHVHGCIVFAVPLMVSSIHSMPMMWLQIIPILCPHGHWLTSFSFRYFVFKCECNTGRKHLHVPQVQCRISHFYGAKPKTCTYYIYLTFRERVLFILMSTVLCMYSPCIRTWVTVS